MLSLPFSLSTTTLLPLQPYATYVLTALINAQAFHILPHSELCPYNPSVLPREIFVEDGQESAVLAALGGEVNTTSTASRPPKKKGRPSKREKLKKAKEALVALEKYVYKNTVTLLPDPTWPEHPVAGSSNTGPGPPQTTHILVAHPPSSTRDNYRVQKDQLLDLLYHDSMSGPLTALSDTRPSDANVGQRALGRANDAILARLRMIDEIVAEKGLEVGGEGGEMTGLARVERAVRHLNASGHQVHRGGVLGLLDGAGLDAEWGIN